MNIKEYQNKVKGCWLGKNIGGTLGAPFECIRGMVDIDFYTQDMSNGSAPNDDLDLQLVWLNAAEKYGKNVNSEILAEYWISYVVANWSEYGAGKNNAAMGITPPLSGWYNNHNRHSCGAFIRSELWACLMPGHPELAVKYAYEDASVDHFGEGLYGELFTAAIESAAFTETDTNKLIDIGLSYIPSDCGIANAVKIARDCYNSGIDYKEARKRILRAEPCSFGMYSGYTICEPEDDIPVGTLGYDAPANIGITIMGWLYGEGDFGKSICIAAGCCEDGDCTAATLGSIMGIIMGADKLPEKWTKPIGDEIKTISLDCTAGELLKIPNKVSELALRVCRLMPVFMGEYCDITAENGPELEFSEILSNDDIHDTLHACVHKRYFNTYDKTPAFSKETTALKTTVSFPDGINIAAETPIRLELKFENLLVKQQWLSVRVFMPDDWECSAGRKFALNLDQIHGGYGYEKANITITPHSISEPITTVVFEISSNGRLSKLYLPVSLINNPQQMRKS